MWQLARPEAEGEEMKIYLLRHDKSDPAQEPWLCAIDDPPNGVAYLMFTEWEVAVAEAKRQEEMYEVLVHVVTFDATEVVP
jgi:hypothetical protein